MKTKLLVVVSDLHCGSEVALAPPEVELDSGNKVSFGNNKHQAWLWDNWKAGFSRVKEIVGADAAKTSLLVNGDAIEGCHHRNSKEIIAQTIEKHVGMAAEVLTPLVELCAKTFVVKGTECHTQDIESYLAKLLCAETGKARDKWHLEINGCLIDAAHHMPTSGRAYLEASAMSICMGNARVNYMRAGHPVPKVFLRGHRHCGGYYSDGAGLFAVTGAWQFLTRHGHKVVTDSIPRPSMLVLDWRGKPEGALPHVHDITFAPPTHETTII